MRYVVQVLTLGRVARARIEVVGRERLIEEADVTPSFIQGTVDEDALRRLLELGLEVSVVARRADDEGRVRGPAGVIVNRGLTRSFGIARRAAPQSYFELELKGLMTPAVRQRLATLGMTILERMADRVWTVRLDGSPNAVRDDPAVVRFAPAARVGTRNAAGIRTFGAPAAAVAAGPPGAPYEALLQPDADPAVIAQALTALGTEILSASGRVVRFIADPSQLGRAAEIDGVVSVDPAGAPRVLDDMVRPLVGVTGPVDSRPGNLDGEGEIVGVADTGLDVEHPDFAGRVVDVVARGRAGDCSDPDGHGTHVTGILAGSGAASDGLLAGVAPRARIHFQSLLDANGGLGGLPDDIGELFAEAYAAGVRVHNDSWGIFLNARYPGVSLQVDGFIHSHPDFLAVVAAGNDGSCLPGLNVVSGHVDIPSMAAPGTSKNALVVGASRSSRADLGYAGMTYGEAWPDSFGSPPISLERVSGDPEGLAAFSARGPTDDHRIKPDVVAPGTDVVSARSAHADLWRFWGSYPGNDRYAVMGGTSMACPVVAGLAVLVRQWFRRERDHAPSAALMRATIVNGARALTGADAVASPLGRPNFHQGFGKVDLLRSVPTADCGFALSFIDTLKAPDLKLIAGGDCVRFRFEVQAAGELRLCLAWTDPPGRGLQNSLFMTLEEPSGTLHHSNSELATFMRLATPLPLGLPAGTVERDPNNNVHVLRVAEATAGSYEVTVASWDLMSEQGYALVVTGAVGDLIPVADA